TLPAPGRAQWSKTTTGRRGTVTDSLGALIRACRVRQGWTQDQLAAATGTHRECVSQFEHGRRYPPAGWLTQAARALDAPELLQAERTGPFEGVAFNDGLDTAAAWDEEERREAEAALARIRRACRRGEPIRTEDVEQLIDALVSWENVLLAVGRAG